MSSQTQPGCAILVVDDDELQRQIVAKRLQKLGCVVEEAEDGASAFLQWQAGAFDLILSDWHMPEVDGLELARLVRSEERLSARPDVVFVCLSAERVDEAAIFAGLPGVNRFFQKPLLAATLAAIVELATGAATQGRSASLA